MSSPEIIRFCDHWNVRLEENENQVLMKISGAVTDGRWITSPPVKEIYITYEGWEAWTWEAGKVYLPYRSGLSYPGRVRGLWGSVRRDWSALADRLPEKLAIFARLWEDPLENYLNDKGPAADNIAAIETWRKKYKIQSGSAMLLAYATSIRHTLGQNSFRDIRGKLLLMPDMEKKHSSEIFLYLHHARPGFYWKWDCSGRKYDCEWDCGYMDVEEDREPLFTTVCRWKAEDSEISFTVSLSYHVCCCGRADYVENRLELVKALYWYDSPADRQESRGEGDKMRIMVCNRGNEDIWLCGNVGHGKEHLWPAGRTWIELEEKITASKKFVER